MYSLVNPPISTFKNSLIQVNLWILNYFQSSQYRLKLLILSIYTLQNTYLIYVMRYTFNYSNDKICFKSTILLNTELCKFIISSAIFIFTEKSFKLAIYSMFTQTITHKLCVAKIFLIAFLFLIQNNLTYIAISNLDTITYQVLYQLKIFTTAVFSIKMLHIKLSMKKWCALTILVIGIILVQIEQINRKDIKIEKSLDNKLIGVSAIFMASVLSGFNCVLYEKMLGDTRISLWVRNIQLYIFSILFCLIFNISYDYKEILLKGFWYGYTKYAYMTIMNASLGGIIVSLVMKYAGNILKAFGLSIGIILCSLIGLINASFHPNIQYGLGVVLVLIASNLYGLN